MANGQAVGRALRGAPPHAGAPGGAVLPVLGFQQLGARGRRSVSGRTPGPGGRGCGG